MSAENEVVTAAIAYEKAGAASTIKFHSNNLSSRGRADDDDV